MCRVWIGALFLVIFNSIVWCYPYNCCHCTYVTVSVLIQLKECCLWCVVFSKYMSIRSSESEPQLREWTICKRQSGLQTDGSSCGVFTAMVVVVSFCVHLEQHLTRDFHQCGSFCHHSHHSHCVVTKTISVYVKPSCLTWFVATLTNELITLAQLSAGWATSMTG